MDEFIPERVGVYGSEIVQRTTNEHEAGGSVESVFYCTHINFFINICSSNKMNELILKDEVFQIVSCALEVLNTLGHGLLEKPYENALAVEFGLRGIPVKQPIRCQLQND